jgi:hypothetical protein
MTKFAPNFAKLYYGARSVSVLDKFSEISIDPSSESHLSLLRDKITERLTEVSGGFRPSAPKIRVFETSRGTKHISFHGSNRAFEVRFKEVA